ncbi:hypothetical protein IQ254_07480 [Nodosilinea sp. LEGE 07088]|uniref:C2 domain-containing protein n=1 Tax=Nodosilinea sp. LEGE 07088 TaxID=2777968 RepID=UPI001881A510|nr:C2 domain-containing protein [Nodosilinea sp. LEGE 07088]MBE9137043.1 hypothetical protein [Nodosilinea sp. LEGE 07088]
MKNSPQAIVMTCNFKQVIDYMKINFGGVMKDFSKYVGLLSSATFVALIGVSKPALSQNTDYLRVTINSVDVHRLLDRNLPNKRSAELYAKVKFPYHQWLHSNIVGGNSINPRWTFSRNVRSANSHSIDIEIWDHDRRGGDDRGLNASIDIVNISNCTYGVAVDNWSDKVIYQGQSIEGGCRIRERLRGSHVIADFTVEAFHN